MSIQTDYLNRTIWCKVAPSPIHGVGVFAVRDILKGQQLTDYYGGVFPFYTLSREEFKELIPEVSELVSQRTIFRDELPLTFMSPNSNQIMQTFMNHSDDANSDGKFALRDIKKGEEVTENYHKL